MIDKRNKQLLPNAECVRDHTLRAVARLRWLGDKTVTALNRIAKHAGRPERRIRTIVFQDQPYVVPDAERRHWALSIADLFDRIADEYEEQAAICRADSEAIRRDEREQLTLPLGGEWDEQKFAA